MPGLLILALFLAGVLCSCIKTDFEEKAKVETGAITGILAREAQAEGTIIDLGEGITDHGHCWSEQAGPTVSSQKTNLGSQTSLGKYISQLTSLKPGVKYYVKAWAKSGEDILYGKEVGFTTLDGTAAITTAYVTEITINSAKSGGSVTDDGGSTVTIRGVCWSTMQNPTTGGSKTANENGIGSYTSILSGLQPYTTYYVRAYATNDVTTTYGNQQTFKTKDGFATITTNSVTGVSANTATCGGNITSDGDSPITSRGVCWSASQNPTISDTRTTNGSGIGSFASNIAGLEPNTTYYVRAYATNEVTTTYGNQQTFKTKTGSATITTISVTNITINSASSGGNISDDGGSSITSRGVCWSTSQNPTIINSSTTDGSGTGSFSSSITGLQPNTTYYVRAYATNDVTTTYSNQQTFKTKDGFATITTNSVTGISANTATCGGNITSDGDSPITSRGVCWSTSQNPTISDTRTTNGSGIGSFASNIAGLEPNTTYYVRAYATNEVTTTYGNQQTFKTKTGSATITTISVTNITTNSATSGGNISDDGGSSITSRGVCWSTSQNPTIINSSTTEGNGTGSFTSNLTGLQPNTTYYIRAYATNSFGTHYGNQVNFLTGCRDADGNTYNPIIIGSQVWMMENLKTTKYNDGTVIPNVTSNDQWSSTTTGAYCWYNNSISNKDVYGALYNWTAVSTGKLCPIGWHVPTDEEWTVMEDYLIANQYNYDGATTGNKIAKSLATLSGWTFSTITGAIGNTDYPVKRNASGFSALPGGLRNYLGTFYHFGYHAYWWSATGDGIYAWNRDVYYNNISIGRYYNYLQTGFSVRCVRDN